LDTRTKILPWADFTQTAGTKVAGYFDPLTVEHSDRLQELAASGGPLCIAIYNPDRPLLPAEARAALMASLDCVQAVAIAEAELPNAIDVRAEDLKRRESMMAHVHSRHGR
jgi:bifunctional ADP-heptose synthase (sugar kinase/adenylyltransferase)